MHLQVLLVNSISGFRFSSPSGQGLSARPDKPRGLGLSVLEMVLGFKV